MRIITKMILGLATAAILVSCINNESIDATNISSLLQISNSDTSFLLDNTQIQGFQNTDDAAPTPIHMSLTGSATENNSCLTSLDRQSISGSDTQLIAGEKSFITYSDGLFIGSDSFSSEVLYFSTSLCSDLTLNADINFMVGNSKYNGYISFTFP